MHKGREGSLGVRDSDVSQELQLSYPFRDVIQNKFMNKFWRANRGSQNLPTIQFNGDSSITENSSGYVSPLFLDLQVSLGCIRIVFV